MRIKTRTARSKTLDSLSKEDRERVLIAASEGYDTVVLGDGRVFTLNRRYRICLLR